MKQTSCSFWCSRSSNPLSHSISDPLSASNLFYFHLDYSSHNFSLANFWCLRYFQMHYPHHYWLNYGQFYLYSRHLILEFILQIDSLQKTLVTKVIFPTIRMQRHHHVECLTRMLSQCLPDLKYILCVLFACFECKISSV